MVLRGHIQNGRVEIDMLVALPEGAKVEVTVCTGSNTEASEAQAVPTLLERLQSVVGIVNDLPADSSINLDHYLYGHPKQ